MEYVSLFPHGNPGKDSTNAVFSDHHSLVSQNLYINRNIRCPQRQNDMGVTKIVVLQCTYCKINR